MVISMYVSVCLSACLPGTFPTQALAQDCHAVGSLTFVSGVPGSPHLEVNAGRSEGAPGLACKSRWSSLSSLPSQCSWLMLVPRSSTADVKLQRWGLCRKEIKGWLKRWAQPPRVPHMRQQPLPDSAGSLGPIWGLRKRKCSGATGWDRLKMILTDPPDSGGNVCWESCLWKKAGASCWDREKSRE